MNKAKGFSYITNKLNINLRPQNLSLLNYFEITREYEDLVN